MNPKVIYFDNNATTRVDDEVIDAMLPYFKEYYGNASSKHVFGWQAEAALVKARNDIATFLNAGEDELIFTSGATESINLALKGICEAYKSKGDHIITVKTEHKAVLDVCEQLQKNGFQITYLNVDREGLIDIDELKAAITDKTLLVSVMAANNETGVIQDVERIGEICKEMNVIFFTDATQYIGKMRCDVKELNVSCMAFSAHKFHGPKGVGALYVKRKDPRINLLAQIHGGGHQHNYRSGTINVPGIVGLAKACEIAQRDYWELNTHISKLKNYFEHQLLDMDGLIINGSTRHRLYTTSNITFPKSVDLKKLLTRFAFSSGSACASNSTEPSHVLTAMNIPVDETTNSFRFSFSKFNSIEEVHSIVEGIKKLQR